MAKTQKRRRAQRLPRERREADILSAARVVFRERGYENASISEIADRAGIVEGSIYRYYENKRHLLIKVIEQWYAELLSKEGARSSAARTTRERLRHAIRQHLKAIHDEPGLSRLVFTEFRPNADYRNSTIFALNRRYTAKVTDIVRAAVASGEFRSDISAAVVRDLIFGGIEHHTWAFLRGEGDFNVDDTADKLAELVGRGLALPPDATTGADTSTRSARPRTHDLALRRDTDQARDGLHRAGR